MFSLADKVLGDNQWIGTVIGDHRNLGRTSEHINPDAAIEHAFGLGNKAVARSDKNPRRPAGEQPERHGRDPLHSTKRQNGVSATPNFFGASPSFGPSRSAALNAFKSL